MPEVICHLGRRESVHSMCSIMMFMYLACSISNHKHRIVCLLSCWCVSLCMIIEQALSFQCQVIQKHLLQFNIFLLLSYHYLFTEIFRIIFIFLSMLSLWFCFHVFFCGDHSFQSFFLDHSADVRLCHTIYIKECVHCGYSISVKEKKKKKVAGNREMKVNPLKDKVSSSSVISVWLLHMQK